MRLMTLQSHQSVGAIKSISMYAYRLLQHSIMHIGMNTNTKRKVHENINITDETEVIV